LRFDALDHLMLVTGCDGTSESVDTCIDLLPVSSSRCRAYDRCYTGDDHTWCYDESDGGNNGGGPVSTDVYGTECVCAEISLHGGLTAPSVENVTTGERFTYSGVIDEGHTVVVDTCEGTAFLDGTQNVTGLLRGDTRMQLLPATNTFRLTSTGGSDNGSATVCHPWAVVSS